MILAASSAVIKPWAPFKEGVQYEYAYETHFELPNPVIDHQSIKLKLECDLKLRFKKQFIVNPRQQKKSLARVQVCFNQ